MQKGSSKEMGNLEVEEVGVEQVLGLPVTVHVKKGDDEESEGKRCLEMHLKFMVPQCNQPHS